MLLCRLCKNEDNEKLISVWCKESELAKRINDCVSVDIKEDDGFPQVICCVCEAKIVVWENFRDICQNSQIFFSESLSKIKVENSNEYLQESPTVSKISSIENVKIIKENHDKENQNGTSVPYSCDICYDMFDTCFEYLDHQETHNGMPVFNCKQCSEVFLYREHLINHEKNHKQSCIYCGKLITKSAMKLHLIIHTDRFKCNECGNTFTCQRTLDTHVAQRHSNTKDHICDTCGKSFSSEILLKTHMRIHRTELKFRCDQCDYRCRTSSCLYSHKNVHGKEQLVCHICSKSFKSKRNLNDHLRRVHSSTKKYECLHCGKKFSEKYQLTVHQRWHTGDRRYKCHFCLKAFVRADSLRVHLAIHQPEKTFGCKQCGKKFKARKSVLRHTCC